MEFMLEAIQPFLLSFMIGLLIGIERERSQVEGIKVIGMRTFILFALLGTLAAELNNLVLTFTLSSFVFLAILISYFRTSQLNDKPAALGITTEMAAASVFILGYLALSQRLLATFIATTVLIILYGRHSLHQFAKEKITAKEIEASIVILVISLSIISFLPDYPLDPWQMFNPRTFGIIFLALAVLQFGGYVMIRLFGEQLGMLLTGFFGGLVSSTAVFASISQSKRAKIQSTHSAVIAGIYAIIASLFEFLMVIFLVSPPLLKLIIWPTFGMMIFGASISWFFMQKNHKPPITLSPANPLDLTSLLKLVLLLIGILMLATFIKLFFGQHLLWLTTFITGLFEIQAMTYAIASLFSKESLTLSQSTELFALIILASFVSKYLLVWIIDRRHFATIISLIMSAMLMIGGSIYWFVMI